MPVAPLEGFTHYVKIKALSKQRRQMKKIWVSLY